MIRLCAPVLALFFGFLALAGSGCSQPNRQATAAPPSARQPSLAELQKETLDKLAEADKKYQKVWSTLVEVKESTDFVADAKNKPGVPQLAERHLRLARSEIFEYAGSAIRGVRRDLCLARESLKKAFAAAVAEGADTGVLIEAEKRLRKLEANIKAYEDQWDAFTQRGELKKVD